jgi:hypothetical protein
VSAESDLSSVGELMNAHTRAPEGPQLPGWRISLDD